MVFTLGSVSIAVMSEDSTLSVHWRSLAYLMKAYGNGNAGNVNDDETCAGLYL